MIRVSVDVENLLFRMEGHANFAPLGSDIVCAAATMLASTLISRVMRVTDPGDVLECALESGCAILDVKPAKHRKCNECRIIFAAMLEGYDMLAKQYPNHVTVD